MANPLANIELVIANTLFGVSYSIMVRLLESRLSYQEVFLLQLVVSALIFIPIALLNPHRRCIPWRDMLHIALCGVVTIYGWSLLTLRGVAHSTPIVVASLSTLGPTITILAATISRSWDRRRSNGAHHLSPSSVRIVGVPILLLLLVCGIIIHDVPTLSLMEHLRSTATVVVAVVCMGVSTVIISNLQGHYGTSTILAIYFAVALLLLPLFIPNFSQLFVNLTSLNLSHSELLEFALFPVITMSLPLYLLYRGALQLTPLHTALYRYIQPLIALFVILSSSAYRHDAVELRPLLSQLVATLLLTISLLLISTTLIPKKLIE